jgi:hypothetical protein
VAGVSERELEFDGGPEPTADAPPAPIEGAAAGGAPAAGPEVRVLGTPDELGTPPPQWEVRTFDRCMGAFVYLPLHLWFARRGPDDAFQPDSETRSEIAESGSAVFNKWAMLRALSKYADEIAFTGALGAYAQSELGRIRDYREALGEGVPLVPDADLAAIYTATEHRAGDEQGIPAAQVRAWRPTNYAQPDLS